jgi:hypothetical protein
VLQAAWGGRWWGHSTFNGVWEGQTNSRVQAPQRFFDEPLRRAVCGLVRTSPMSAYQKLAFAERLYPCPSV